MPASVSMYAFFGLVLFVVASYVTVTRGGVDYLTFAIAAMFFVMSGVAYKRYRDICISCQ